MKKYLILILLAYLISSEAYGNDWHRKNTDIVIVRNKEKLQKYSKLFVKFIPEHFKFDEQQNLMHYSTTYAQESKGDKLKIIEEYYNNDLDFNIYAIVQENNNMLEFFRIFADANDQSYNDDGRFLVEVHYSDNEESLICFLGIVSEADCLDRVHFVKNQNLDIKVLKEYLKNVQNTVVKYGNEETNKTQKSQKIGE